MCVRLSQYSTRIPSTTSHTVSPLCVHVAAAERTNVYQSLVAALFGLVSFLFNQLPFRLLPSAADHREREGERERWIWTQKEGKVGNTVREAWYVCHPVTPSVRLTQWQIPIKIWLSEGCGSFSMYQMRWYKQKHRGVCGQNRTEFLTP